MRHNDKGLCDVVSGFVFVQRGNTTGLAATSRMPGMDRLFKKAGYVLCTTIVRKYYLCTIVVLKKLSGRCIKRSYLVVIINKLLTGTEFVTLAE